MLVNLTQGDVNKIQIDEGIVITNYKLENERIIGPVRGGVEVVITPTVRDIEYDGRRGKTAGMQVKDEEDVSAKFNTICSSQENLQLGLIGPKVTGTKIEQGEFGLIKKECYLKNIAVVTMMLDGTFKILTIKNVMHEGAFTFKPTPKGENEHSLEMLGHYNAFDKDEKMWVIDESVTNPIVQ